MNFNPMHQDTTMPTLNSIITDCLVDEWLREQQRRAPRPLSLATEYPSRTAGYDPRNSADCVEDVAGLYYRYE